LKTKRSNLQEFHIPIGKKQVQAVLARAGEKMGRMVGRMCFMVLVFVGTAAQAASDSSSQSGLPVPRFVSLKSDKVNVRGGPTKDNDVAWVYTRPGLPVEITAEYENWRRIRDWEGAEGWVYHSLLSGKRTALVTKAKNADELVAVYDSPDAKAPVKARLQPGVVGTVKRCADGFCRVIGEGFDGYVEQERLFGVYLNEKVE
jgi:SH3-like domain-containing protein